MKVTDLRRKLLASLAAGGMLAPSAMYAADLNQNLVVNGGFENVDVNVVGSFGSRLILDWTPSIPLLDGNNQPNPATTAGFAYCHTHQGCAASPTVPNYADGTPPPGSGSWYFTSNRDVFMIPGANYIDQPGEFYQDIDVSTGNAAALIATGLARFNMSAHMSSYDTDADYGNVHAEFRNGTTVLGSAVISDPDFGPNNVWGTTPTSLSDFIPVGTTSVRLSIYGTKDNGSGAGPDGYIDNVDFRVNELTQLVLVVDRDNGNLTIKNFTNGAVPISAYSITSNFQAMAPANWTSIADIYDQGNPGPNQVDAAHAWREITQPGTHTDLSEADLNTGLGGAIGLGKIVNLGNGTWIQTPTEDLVFKYISNGQVVTGLISYVDNVVNNVPSKFMVGDFNLDNEIDSDDWVILRSHQLQDMSNLSLAQAYRFGDLTGDKFSDHADFVMFKSLFEGTNGGGSFAMMLTSVPEPTCIVLALAAGVFVLPLLRRRTNH